MSKKGIDAPRGEHFKVDPDDLVILGVDQGEFDNPADRARMQRPEIDDGFVASIISFGVIQPVIAYKLAEGKYAVAAGRRRVLGARAANKRIAEEAATEAFVAEFGPDAEPVRVNTMIFRGSPDEVRAIAALENSGKLPETMAQKADRLRTMMATLPAKLDEGAKIQRMAHAFSVSTTAIRQWLKLDEASAGVRRALDAGQINATAAVKIIQGAETKTAQDEALALLLASGEKVTSGKAATAAARTKKPKDGAGKDRLPAGNMASKRKVQLALKRIQANGLRASRDEKVYAEAALEFVLGILDETQYESNDKVVRMLLDKDKLDAGADEVEN